MIELREEKSKDKILILGAACFALVITVAVLYFSKRAQQQSVYSSASYAASLGAIKERPAICSRCDEVVGVGGNAARICFEKTESLKKEALRLSAKCFRHMLTSFINKNDYLDCREKYTSVRGQYAKLQKECIASCDVNSDDIFSTKDIVEYSKTCLVRE